jgi:hypothetical protein
MAEQRRFLLSCVSALGRAHIETQGRAEQGKVDAMPETA